MTTLEREASTRRVGTLVLVLGALVVAAGGIFGGAAVRSAIERHRAVSRFDAEVAAHNDAVARHDGALARTQRSLAQVSAAATAMSRAQERLNGTLGATNKRMNSCSSAHCFDSLNVTNARAAAAFGRRMRDARVPAGASALVQRLASETGSYQKSWVYMSHATSLGDVEKRAQISEETEGQFYAADNALAKWLKDQAAALQGQETALDAQASALGRSGDALRQRSQTLNVPADVRTARPSRQPVTSAA